MAGLLPPKTPPPLQPPKNANNLIRNNQQECKPLARSCCFLFRAQSFFCPKHMKITSIGRERGCFDAKLSNVLQKTRLFFRCFAQKRKCRFVHFQQNLLFCYVLLFFLLKNCKLYDKILTVENLPRGRGAISANKNMEEYYGKVRKSRD